MTDLEHGQPPVGGRPDRLAEIRQRRAATTRTPWRWDIEGGIWSEDAGRVGTFYLEREGQLAAHAPDDIDWLVGEVERLRGLLREIEWSGDGLPPDFMPLCPACKGHKQHGHHSDCKLAAVLHAT